MPISFDPQRDLSDRAIRRWNDVIGNEKVKDELRALVAARRSADRVIVIGPPGSGKTTLLRHACRGLTCTAPADGEPCEACWYCRELATETDQMGLFASIRDVDHERPMHYVPLSGRGLTRDELARKLSAVVAVTGHRIIHVEETKSLARLQLDEVLTQYMDGDFAHDTTWLFSGTSTRGLSPEFVRRAGARLLTSPPTAAEMCVYLAKLTAQLEIGIDHPSTWELLSEKVFRIVGLAVPVLQAARLSSPPRLTRELVMNSTFPAKDPWTVRRTG
jgi:DNA polymerase III delta prime subunit